MALTLALFDRQSRGRWLPQFGKMTVGSGDVHVTAGESVDGRVHAEAHREGFVGADFTYSANINPRDWSGLSADLQFWISDEGRYGVRLQSGLISLYRFVRPSRRCSDDPDVFAHCPLWSDGSDPKAADPFTYEVLGTSAIDLPPKVTVAIEVMGGEMTVFVGGRRQLSISVSERGVGRFGVYALADTALEVDFTELRATHDPTAQSNFALLYSTAGYDTNGTKRALLRTLNDLPSKHVVREGSRFRLRDASGHAVVDSPLIPLPTPDAGQRMFGMQLWPVNLPDVPAPGRYTLEVVLNTTSGPRAVLSKPFAVRPGLVTATMLKPLSILNAQARRAAEEDLRRNWQVEAGRSAWSVGLDGAFIADRADDGVGAVLRRVLNCGNTGLDAREFRYLGRITIVSGCDAQLQFWITPAERWAVTLQAGAAGGCRHGSGPGAIRLHREGPDFFEPIASKLFDSFVVGRPYDIEIRVGDGRIVVLVGRDVMLEHDALPPDEPALQLGLKAWASTARFEGVQAWARNVALSRPEPGVVIPYFSFPGTIFRASPQGIAITVGDLDVSPRPQPDDDAVRYPLMAQQHGYQDCNNFIGEATSHGVFLAGLMDVWSGRARMFAPSEIDALRHAIITAVLYLQDLWEQGNRTGEFAHQEPGRGAMTPGAGVPLTRCAVYGLASFAELGATVDLPLARHAAALALTGQQWLAAKHAASPELNSIVFWRLANAAARDGRPEEHAWRQQARDAARVVLDMYSPTGAIAGRIRETLNSIPWFEGVRHVYAGGLDDVAQRQVEAIAAQLKELADRARSGFCVVPQATDGPQPQEGGLARHNWNSLTEVPLAVRPIPLPPDSVGDWYITEHFATAAIDCVSIGRLAHDRTLEKLATGNLHWITGLNPGVPTTKLAAGAATAQPWGAASFVYNGPGAFARTIEGFRTTSSSSKGWKAAWEESADSRHRETWWIDPLPNGFQTIVNGHVLRESQWHYWSTGVSGWVSGETFMMIDGSFLKASLALEDWHSEATTAVTSPYDVTRPHRIDTTHVDRVGTGWGFDDPARIPFAQATRMAHEFGVAKGFGGARPTGHHAGERVGALCIPASARFVDVTDEEIESTPWRFADINAAGWSQVARTATEIAARRGDLAGGYFTGHQVPGRRGLIGLGPDIAQAFDVTDAEVAATPWAFADINTVGWAQAARAATDICRARGFAGGFFTGRQAAGVRGILALFE